MTVLLLSATYDPEADAARWRLAPGQVVESEEVAPGVILDYDADGRILAVEVMQASRRLAGGPPALPAAAE